MSNELYSFFYKNKLYKNNGQNIKNMLRTFEGFGETRSVEIRTFFTLVTQIKKS